MGQQEATVYCPFINRSRVHGINKWSKRSCLVEEFAWRASNKRCEETDPDAANDNQIKCTLMIYHLDVAFFI